MKQRMHLVTLVLLASATSMAHAEEIMFVSQGGSYQEAQTKAILDPVAKKLGITVNQDSAPDAWPVIKTQTATGKPIWDVVDTPTKDCVRGDEQGMIEPLDFSKIPSAQLLADGEIDMEMAWNGCVAAIIKEGAPVGYSFNEGFLQISSLCILKNAPNLETAIKFKATADALS